VRACTFDRFVQIEYKLDALRTNLVRHELVSHELVSNISNSHNKSIGGSIILLPLRLETII